MNRKYARVFLPVAVAIAVALVHQVFAAFNVVPLGTGTPALTKEDLANRLAGDGIIVCDGRPDGSPLCPSASTVSYTGDPRAAATFTGEKAIVKLESGVVLSTGQASGIVGFFPDPNPSGSTSTVLGLSPNGGGCFSGTSLGVDQFKQGLPGDADLNSLLPAGNARLRTCDATVLQFDFVPTRSDRFNVFLQYVFGSDEYNEAVN